MGNHFRTSGAGDDAPKTQTGVQGSRFAAPDSEGQPVAQAPAQPADQAQPASDPFAYNPTSDVALSGTAGFEPVQAVTARVEQPQAGAATSQPTMAGIPDPLAPATPAPQPAQSGLFAAIPDPTQPAAPVVESDQAAEVASLDNALNNPDFTSVFAPIDPQASRKKMAKQAGVEPVILMEHVTKIYPAQPNKPALDDINIEIYPGEFVFLVGHSGSGKTTLLSTLNRDVKPTSGRILVAGQDLMKIKNRKVPFLRRQIGAVFQDFKLLPQKTAYENVAFALQCIGKPKGVIRSQVPEVLRLVGLADQMDSLPDQLSGGKVPFLRRQIGAVFQDFKLLPQKTAYENVAFALQCIGKPKGVIRSQVPEVLRLVGLADQMDSLPDQLSGGEQQRVAVARAMVNRPPLLICDEPTGNLDPAISLGIMKLLERINRTGTTVIVATHDREMVDSMHRRVIALEGGHVIRDQERGGYGNYGTN